VKIDDRVESLIRDALAAAIKKDIDRLDAAMKAIPASDHARVGELLAIIGGHAVIDLHSGQRPTDERLQMLAARIAEHEQEWSGLAAEDILPYLRIITGDTAQHLDPATTVLMMFVVTASLLAGYPKPEGQWWFDYLDRIEAVIEAAP
jgi:hypothetical protein